MSTGQDQLTTALAQAWVGGIAAWSQLWQTFIGTVIEGAKTEVDVKAVNQYTVEVPAQSQTVQLGVTQLKQSPGAAIIPPSRLSLSQSAVLAGQAASVVVTASPENETVHPPGMYLGNLIDASAPAVQLGQKILMIISPPVA